jgi:acetyl-CoA C-acetyltransferase
MQALMLAAQSLTAGDAEIAVGGGVEAMSRSAYLMQQARWGARMGDVPLQHYILDILQYPFYKIHMGITAENVANLVRAFPFRYSSPQPSGRRQPRSV